MLFERNFPAEKGQTGKRCAAKYPERTDRNSRGTMRVKPVGTQAVRNVLVRRISSSPTGLHQYMDAARQRRVKVPRSGFVVTIETGS